MESLNNSELKGLLVRFPTVQSLWEIMKCVAHRESGIIWQKTSNSVLWSKVSHCGLERWCGRRKIVTWKITHFKSPPKSLFQKWNMDNTLLDGQYSITRNYVSYFDIRFLARTRYKLISALQKPCYANVKNNAIDQLVFYKNEKSIITWK